MKGAAIVPYGNAALAPGEAAGKFGPYLVLKQVFEDRRAFFFGHTLEMGCMREIDEKGLAAGFGMRAHGGMLGNVGMILIAAG